MGTIERYVHHGRKVYVDVLLKGKHRYHCLCFRCSSFVPRDRVLNCDVAEMLYRICCVTNIVTPVWECPNFVEGTPDTV